MNYPPTLNYPCGCAATKAGNGSLYRLLRICPEHFTPPPPTTDTTTKDLEPTDPLTLRRHYGARQAYRHHLKTARITDVQNLLLDYTTKARHYYNNGHHDHTPKYAAGGILNLEDDCTACHKLQAYTDNVRLLRARLRRMEENLKEKTYTCDQCHFKTKNRSYYYRHRRNQHPSVYGTEP